MSNVVLDELDKELERRGISFCRFADDVNSYVKSEKAAHRVMKSVSYFIEKKLKLKVNREKSKVARVEKVKFLGMIVLGETIAISKTATKRAFERIAKIIPRGTSETIEQTIKRINEWYTGWANYFKMTSYPNQLYAVEAHIRRRLRARIVRQQKNKRNIYNKLVRRDIPKRKASAVFGNKGWWKLSHLRVVERAFPNVWFIEDLGLKICSNKAYAHWCDPNQWIRLT